MGITSALAQCPTSDGGGIAAAYAQVGTIAPNPDTAALDALQAAWKTYTDALAVAKTAYAGM